jgi:hypothetical protein
MEQEVSKLERRPNDAVAVVELPCHQAAAIPPIKQALRRLSEIPLSCAVKRLRSASVTGEPWHIGRECPPVRHDLPR